MTRRRVGAPPAWLVPFQHAFTNALRLPLVGGSGVLTSTHAAPGLAVYNRQYWFRLFTALQTSYPLTTRLLGAWTFNHVAQAYLRAEPPTETDLNNLGLSFPCFLAREHPPEIVEAAGVDLAFLDVLRSPFLVRWKLGEVSHVNWDVTGLEVSQAVRIVTEHWPLMELRRALPREEHAHAVTLPLRYPTPHTWVLGRTPEGVMQWPLKPNQAKFYELVAKKPLAKAIAEFTSLVPEAEQPELGTFIQAWMAEGMDVGLWEGLKSY